MRPMGESFNAHETISSAILTANLPTLVPPNFCTNHLAPGSMLFWCKFGGVWGGEDLGVDNDEEDGEETGVDSVDMADRE